MPQYGTWMWRVDPATCQTCPVYSIPPSGLPFYSPRESLFLPNGNLLVSGFFSGAFIFDPVTGMTSPVTSSWNIPGTLLAPNGTIYAILYSTTISNLATFDPATNQFTLIGPLPYIVGELFWANGQLHSVIAGFGILQINLSNPAASTLVQSIPNTVLDAATSASNGTIYMTRIGSLETYDLATNTFTPICTELPPYFPANPPFWIDALTVLAPGLPEPPCACFTAAGFPSLPTAFACAPNALNLSFSLPTLDPNDVVRYILYTDATNPLGSILFTQPSPVFQFTSPLLTGVTYFIRQVAGNELNGSFDPADPCLKFSPPVQVSWREKPTVVSLSSDSGFCPGGCGPATIVLSGSPPFSFYWEAQQNGAAIASGTVPPPVSTANSTFQVCLPAGLSSDPVQVVICAVTDAFCTNF